MQRPLVVVNGKPVLYTAVERTIEEVCTGIDENGCKTWAVWDDPRATQTKVWLRSGKRLFMYGFGTRSTRPSGRMMYCYDGPVTEW
jgi:hypothetical protein